MEGGDLGGKTDGILDVDVLAGLLEFFELGDEVVDVGV